MPRRRWSIWWSGPSRWKWNWRRRCSTRQAIILTGSCATSSQGLPAARVAEIIELGLRHRGRHDEALRAFHAGAALRFDILMDIGGFRDMHRHRRCTQILQGFTALHGYETPEAGDWRHVTAGRGGHAGRVPGGRGSGTRSLARRLPQARRPRPRSRRSICCRWPRACAACSRWTLPRRSTSASCARARRPLQLSARGVGDVSGGPAAAPHAGEVLPRNGLHQAHRPAAAIRPAAFPFSLKAKSRLACCAGQARGAGTGVGVAAGRSSWAVSRSALRRAGNSAVHTPATASAPKPPTRVARTAPHHCAVRPLSNLAQFVRCSDEERIDGADPAAHLRRCGQLQQRPADDHADGICRAAHSQGGDAKATDCARGRKRPWPRRRWRRR